MARLTCHLSDTVDPVPHHPEVPPKTIHSLNSTHSYITYSCHCVTYLVLLIHVSLVIVRDPTPPQARRRSIPLHTHPYRRPSGTSGIMISPSFFRTFLTADVTQLSQKTSRYGCDEAVSIHRRSLSQVIYVMSCGPFATLSRECGLIAIG